jgi:NADH-quinone oxidoreductase subunit C
MIESVLAGVTAKCRVKCSVAKTGQEWSVFLPADQLLKAVRNLDKEGYFIEDVCAVDAKEGFLVVYHFDHFLKPGRVSLKVLVPHAAPKIPSIAGIFSGADWHERETHDFHGIEFLGHPHLVPLLLPDDANIHPLVKEDKARAAVCAFTSGEIVACEPGFEATVTPPPEPKKEEAKKPAEKPAA